MENWKDIYNPFFISHMVQIIPSIISRFQYTYILLYIPHGSDNTKVKFYEVGDEIRSLYPTWFR